MDDTQRSTDELREEKDRLDREISSSLTSLESYERMMIIKKELELRGEFDC